MSIKFRSIKWSVLRELQELRAQARADDSDNGEKVLQYILSLVKEWDLKDEDTGEPLAFDDLDNLSGVQITQVLEMFDKAAGSTTVPKSRGGR